MESDEAAFDALYARTREPVLHHVERIVADRAAAELSEGKRSVMDIFLNETPTLREIAQRLGLPLGTVKSRFHYASRELRELLGDQE